MAEMNMRELAVGILQVERDGAVDLTGAAGDLGLSELEALREIDTNAMFRAGDRITDRLADREHDAWNIEPRAASVHIDVEGNGMELGGIFQSDSLCRIPTTS